VNVRVTAAEGAPLVTEWSLAERPEVTMTALSGEPLAKAQKRALDEASLREQLGRLGNTPYQLGALTFEAQGAVFAPVSLLNQVRREAVEQLQALQARSPAVQVRGASAALEEVLAEAQFAVASGNRAQPEAGARREEASVHLLVRTAGQLDAALELRPASITLDYLDLYGLKPWLDRLKTSGIAARVASPRIVKPGEARGIAEYLLQCECALLVRPAGLLQALRGRTTHELTGDFSLNAANLISAAAMVGLGLARLTPAHDLNAAQVAALTRALGGAAIEVVAYQHLPVFHTEHCVFCRFLSTGASYRDCGRPCEEHRVALRDTAGRAHPVMADAGCRNTVFGAEAQEASQHLETWRAAGIARFRLEFAHESADQVTAVTRVFEDALAGRRTGLELMRQLQKVAPQGVTQGSFFIPEDYLTLPVLQ
jgi:putative protease